MGGRRLLDLYSINGSDETTLGITQGVLLTDAAGNIPTFAGPDDISSVFIHQSGTTNARIQLAANHISTAPSATGGSSQFAEEQSIWGYFTSGQYYWPIGTALTSTSIVLGNGIFRWTPAFIPSNITATRIFAEVTTAGTSGAVLRLGIYSRTGELTGSLVVDAGTIDGTVAAVQELTINTPLTRGWYYFGAALEGAPATQPTVRVLTPGGSPTGPIPAGTSLPSAGAVGLGYGATGVTGALPATISGLLSGASAPPRIGIKIA